MLFFCQMCIKFETNDFTGKNKSCLLKNVNIYISQQSQLSRIFFKVLVLLF